MKYEIILIYFWLAETMCTNMYRVNNLKTATTDTKKGNMCIKIFDGGPPGIEPGHPDERKHLNFLLMLYRFT